MLAQRQIVEASNQRRENIENGVSENQSSSRRVTRASRWRTRIRLA
jgi:hypothetical protein